MTVTVIVSLKIVMSLRDMTYSHVATRHGYMYAYGGRAGRVSPVCAQGTQASPSTGNTTHRHINMCSGDLNKLRNMYLIPGALCKFVKSYQVPSRFPGFQVTGIDDSNTR